MGKAEARDAEKRDLSLTPEQRHVTRALESTYKLAWPFAAHLAKDAIAAVNEFRAQANPSPEGEEQ